MVSLYLFSALIGWLFVLFFLFFGGDVDADFDVDVDLDADLDLDPGVDVDAGGPFDALTSFLTFRSLVFFLAFFGLTGLVLTWLDANSVLTVLLAVGMGLFAMWLNRTLIEYLKANTSDSQVLDREIEGSRASVVLPIGPDRKGRVAVDVGGQRRYLVAGPYHPKAGVGFSKGDEVVVVEIKDGAALVAPLDSME
jgi:membrane protein implicated in regulation of membrane protease activity